MKNPICKMFGHKTLCVAEVTLLPDGGALLYHSHRCLRCKRLHTFHTEWLDPTWEAILRRETGNTDWPVSVAVDASFAHR